MTILGADRTGLVESVARLVAGHGGNWLESRMCRLGGQFAGILRIELPRERQTDLIQALEKLQSQGLKVLVYPDTAAATPATGPDIALEIMGQDRPGIVREISHALAGRHVNVEELSSELVSAPMTGETLFKARVLLRLPPDCNLAALRQDLEKIAADLMVDVEFAEAGEPR